MSDAVFNLEWNGGLSDEPLFRFYCDSIENWNFIRDDRPCIDHFSITIALFEVLLYELV